MRVQDAKRRRYARRPLPPLPDDELRWRRFLAELPERIEAIRAEDGLFCRACGSTMPAPVQWKRCSRCNDLLPLDQYHRDRSQAGGRVSACKACTRQDNARQYLARKRKALRRAS